MNEGTDDPEDKMIRAGHLLAESNEALEEIFEAETEADEEPQSAPPPLPQSVPLSALTSAKVVFQEGNWIDQNTGSVIAMPHDEPIPPKPARVPSASKVEPMMNKGMAVNGGASSSSQIVQESDQSAQPMGFTAFIPEGAAVPVEQARKKRSKSASSSSSSEEKEKREEEGFGAIWNSYVENHRPRVNEAAQEWLDMEVTGYINAIVTHVQYGSGRCAEVASHIIDTVFRLYLAIGNANLLKQRKAYTGLTKHIANRMKQAVSVLANSKVPIDQFVGSAAQHVRNDGIFLNYVDLSPEEKDYLRSKINPESKDRQVFATVFTTFCNTAVLRETYVSATILAYSLLCICKVVDICVNPEYLDENAAEHPPAPTKEQITHCVMENCHHLMNSILLQRLAGGDIGLIEEVKVSTSLARTASARRRPEQSSPLFNSLHKTPTAEAIILTMDGSAPTVTSNGCQIL